MQSTDAETVPDDVVVAMSSVTSLSITSPAPPAGTTTAERVTHRFETLERLIRSAMVHCMHRLLDYSKKMSFHNMWPMMWIFDADDAWMEAIKFDEWIGKWIHTNLHTKHLATPAMVLVLLYRVAERQRVPITPRNIYRLILGFTIICWKVESDYRFERGYFRAYMSTMSLDTLQILERATLKLVNYEIFVDHEDPIFNEVYTTLFCPYVSLLDRIHTSYTNVQRREQRQ